MKEVFAMLHFMTVGEQKTKPDVNSQKGLKMTAAAAVETFDSTRKEPRPDIPENNFNEETPPVKALLLRVIYIIRSRDMTNKFLCNQN